jgi:plasmid stabilization system protein ParE
MAGQFIFVRQAIADLHWFRVYHEDHFPEGLEQATRRLQKCLRLLAAFPKMGRSIGKPPRRRFAVTSLPFTVVCRQKGADVEILRILDQRSKSYIEDLFDQS